jgi:hypothetical protein
MFVLIGEKFELIDPRFGHSGRSIVEEIREISAKIEFNRTTDYSQAGK